MEKWEYFIDGYLRHTTFTEIEAHLNSMGKKGWELAVVEFGCFIFKRKLLQEDD